MNHYLKNAPHQLRGTEINALQLVLNAPTEHSSTIISANLIHHAKMGTFGIIIILNVFVLLAISVMEFHVFNAQTENHGTQKKVAFVLKVLLILDQLVNP